MIDDYCFIIVKWLIISLIGFIKFLQRKVIMLPVIITFVLIRYAFIYPCIFIVVKRIGIKFKLLSSK